MKKPTKKQITITAVILAAIIIVIVLLCAKGCASSEVEADSLDTSTVEQIEEDAENGDQTSDAEGEEASEGEPTEEASTGTDGGQDDAITTGSSGTAAAETGVRTASTPTAEGSSSSSGKRWVEDTEQVWVVDPDWTEQVPRTTYKEVNVCNICGNEIKGDVSAHAKEHMMAGQGSGHHTEMRPVTTYETITHTGNGHWETVVTGGHWE